MKHRTPSILGIVFLLLSGCQAPPKNFTQGDWSQFVQANPNDIAVSKVTGEGLPADVRLDLLREALRDELLGHKYSPMSFDYVDASSGSKAGDVRADLVIKKFDYKKYEMSRSMRIVGDFYFRENKEGSDRLLANVASDQTIDLADEARRGAGTDEAIRIAIKRFVSTSLAGMPERRIDAR
jgi:hypothetical protein